MPLTPVTSRVLPFVDAWFDVVASLLTVQRSLTYAVLVQSEPDQPDEQGRHVAAPHPVPDGWRDTSA
jgi:hypothetical protein